MNIQKKPPFITFEGIEGVGKSTAIKFFTAELKARGIDYVMNREPGGTEISESIRRILLAHHAEKMADDTELLLMFACRSQNLMQVIEPALKGGQWVVSDRFTDASYAYQGAGRGMPVDRIQALADWAHGDLQPDITFLLDAPVSVGMERLKNRRGKDRIETEKLEFFDRVRQGYLQLAADFPERFRLIQADQSLEDVRRQLLIELDRIQSSL